MKKIFMFVAAVLPLFSCSEKMPVGNEVESAVYMLSSGETEFTVSEDNTVYSFAACKGGYDGPTNTVDVVWDE